MKTVLCALLVLWPSVAHAVPLTDLLAGGELVEGRLVFSNFTASLRTEANLPDSVVLPASLGAISIEGTTVGAWDGLALPFFEATHSAFVTFEMTFTVRAVTGLIDGVRVDAMDGSYARLGIGGVRVGYVPVAGCFGDPPEPGPKSAQALVPASDQFVAQVFADAQATVTCFPGFLSGAKVLFAVPEPDVMLVLIFGGLALTALRMRNRVLRPKSIREPFLGDLREDLAAMAAKGHSRASVGWAAISQPRETVNAPRGRGATRISELKLIDSVSAEKDVTCLASRNSFAVRGTLGRTSTGLTAQILVAHHETAAFEAPASVEAPPGRGLPDPVRRRIGDGNP